MQFIDIYWRLMLDINRRGNNDSFREEFYEKLQTLQTLIDEGADINVPERRTGLTCLDITINRFHPEQEYTEELLYFLLSQDTIRPTFDTVYMTAIVREDPKLTEEVLKRLDDETLQSIKNQFKFYLPCYLREVFKGFKLRN